MTELIPLYYFSIVVQQGNFQKAAHQLNISPSAISHAITTLEKKLKIQLLHRTTRHVTITPKGQIILNALVPSFKSISQAIEEAKEASGNLTGHLKITAPRTLSQTFLLPIIQKFTEQHPQVKIELDSNDALVSQGFDLGLRFNEVLQQDMTIKKLNIPIKMNVVASKKYLEKYGKPKDPKDLLLHRCIGRKFATGRFLWNFMPVQPQFFLIFNDDEFVIDAVKKNLGIAYIFGHLIDDENLVTLLPEWTHTTEFCYLYWYKQNIMRPVVRHFLDFIQEWNLKYD